MSSQLASNNLYSVLHPKKLENKINFANITEREYEMYSNY